MSVDMAEERRLRDERAARVRGAERAANVQRRVDAEPQHSPPLRLKSKTGSEIVYRGRDEKPARGGAATREKTRSAAPAGPGGTNASAGRAG